MNPVEIVISIITAAGGSAVIVAGLAAWLGKIWADRIAQDQKLLVDIDVDLRKRRIDVYQELWSLTSLLPKWPRATGVTYEQLMAFSQSLRTWYFEKGGLYLSRSTHDNAYSPLQEALADALRSNTAGAISTEHYEAIRERCSLLRTALANDVESRREGPD